MHDNQRSFAGGYQPKGNLDPKNPPGGKGSIPLPTFTKAGLMVASISDWLDQPRGRDQTAHMLYRVTKVSAEAGESIDALEGYLGWNPRKGVIHSLEDVKYELLDTALAALGAYEHLSGNKGESMLALEAHIHKVHERMRLVTADE